MTSAGTWSSWGKGSGGASGTMATGVSSSGGSEACSGPSVSWSEAVVRIGGSGADTDAVAWNAKGKRCLKALMSSSASVALVLIMIRSDSSMATASEANSTRGVAASAEMVVFMAYWKMCASLPEISENDGNP